MKEEVKNNSNINKNSNIKQILILIFFIIIITIGIYITNNYKDNENNGNEQLVNSYTLETIPEYSSEPYITIKNNIPNFNDEDFTTSSFENQVRKYLNDNPDKHVLYRVTPIYEEENLVASGVTIEAESVEDKGASICFYVYIYNVQPGVIINYATGESKLAE